MVIVSWGPTTRFAHGWAVFCVSLFFVSVWCGAALAQDMVGKAKWFDDRIRGKSPEEILELSSRAPGSKERALYWRYLAATFPNTAAGHFSQGWLLNRAKEGE